MYIDILQYIEDVKARLGSASKTYGAILQAHEDHESLKAHQDGGIVRLCSSGVNPYVDQMDIDRGQDLYVYPFVKDRDSIIYSDPPFYFIGSRNTDGFGIVPSIDWEEEMKDDDVNDDLIKTVREFLRANIPYDLPE